MTGRIGFARCRRAARTKVREFGLLDACCEPDVELDQPTRCNVTDKNDV